jgi:PTS system ascorbate-specific IIA component
MNNGIFIIAHAPLASALRQCVLHVFPDAAQVLSVLDVQPQMPLEDILSSAKVGMNLLRTQHILVLTDVLGATPCNVAQQLVDGVNSQLVAGVNLPMLLRAVTYCSEPLDILVDRAMAGGTQGVTQVDVTPTPTPPTP